ncbi:MAG: TonB-dependent receptor [Flavobacteriia bacterium]|nr:MAG: TonB-dependent receptor [Flavobacteriia bacterium]
MKNFKNVLALALFLVGATLMAQSTLTGVVVDENDMPLPGADVTVKGTTRGTVTDFDGNFTLECKMRSGEIVVNYMGYEQKTFPFQGAKRFGTIKLVPSANTLEEVVIVGQGIVDLAQDRKTPVAVSTIKSGIIQQKAANLDLPDLLTTTPSVQSIQGGGYGDGKMYLRGFNQSNTAFLLNGQPINGMEDGKMYWSNWSGVLDIANAVQIQRGLGSSKLAISSVGGTVNIVTKTIDKKEGGFFQGTIANDNYYKGTLYYNTGLLENGLAVGAMFGYWQGDGWRNGTAGQGQTYYLSLGYKPNESNVFNFLITGAPQWHGDAWEVKLQDYLNSEHGGKFNPYYGYKNGKLYSGLRNFYHKPIANLSWDFTLNERSSISTVLYGSLGRGGYAYMQGAAFGLVKPDVDGGMDFDSLIESNNAAQNANGFQKGSYNGHNWYGLVSNLETALSDNTTLNFGADVRMYNGLHFRAAVDLMGDYGFSNSSDFSGTYTVDNEFGGFNPWSAVFNWNNDHKQRFSYDYEEFINYYGAFGQLEYASDLFSTFFQGAVSNQTHVAKNYYNYSTVTESEKISNLGYNVKGGFALNINENNKTFVNAGYYSRQPFHDNLFVNLRKSVDLNELADKNETVLGVELGHTLNNEQWDANLNVYYTKWGNRTNVYPIFDESTNIIKYNVQANNINQIHKGIELDTRFRPMDNLKLFAFVSYGDWVYGKEPTLKVFDDETGDEVTDTYTGELPGQHKKGDKIGGAPQFSAGLGMDWDIAKDFTFDINERFYDNLYTFDGLELPAYSLTDAGLNYKLRFDKGMSLNFNFNVRNIFNNFYIASSRTSIPVTEDSVRTWKGIDTNNRVRIGFGRTWNASVRLNF